MVTWDLIDYLVLLGTLHLTWLLVQIFGGILLPFLKPQPSSNLLNSASTSASSVLVLIPVCNESPVILKRTLAKCLQLPEAEIVVIENSTRSGVKADLEKVCKELNVSCYSIENLGNKARAINHYLQNQVVSVDYVSVLDVDQEPEPAFLKSILPYFQEDENLGLVQTPQAFRNENKSWLTFVYAAMQSIFFRG
ncbi:MAG: glycosyltransferase, partial [Bacteroidota bacterium]